MTSALVSFIVCVFLLGFTGYVFIKEDERRARINRRLGLTVFDPRKDN